VGVGRETLRDGANPSDRQTFQHHVHVRSNPEAPPRERANQPRPAGQPFPGGGDRFTPSPG
jgi:hypothetical protein